MKNKKIVFILVLILAIGFASVSTTLVLNGTIGISTKKDDFNVIFTEGLLDGETTNVTISEDKENITFTAKTLYTVGDSTTLNYKVKNTSTQYDANVTINCTNNADENVEITSSFDGYNIPLAEPVNMLAQEVKSGYISAELIKSYAGEEKEINISCSLVVNAESKEELSYTLNFDSDGGSSVEDKIVNYNGTYGVLPVPEKEGYVFLGWYDENDKKVESSLVIDIKGNKTLHAKWALVCPYEVGQTWEFDYTGGEQEFDVPCNGEYKMEAWGAQGSSLYSTGGYGGYSVGTVFLNEVQTLYTNVGGQGIEYTGGYNGGGKGVYNPTDSAYGSAGGGATHIATSSGLLSTFENNQSDLLIVTGGGGGSAKYTATIPGGAGGGYNGGKPYYNDWTNNNYYKSQNIGSGQSANTPPSNNDIYSYEVIIYRGKFGIGNSNGGGGFYGGNHHWTGNRIYSGSGGSGYIGNPLLTNKTMYCYNCATSNVESTKTISTTCTSKNPTANCAKQGHGYARITLLSATYK